MANFRVENGGAQSQACTEQSDGEECVRWAYRLLLGREPENAEAVTRNPYKADRRKLIASILNSEEFKRENLIDLSSTPQIDIEAEFDIRKLRQRDRRWKNIAELRSRWANAVPMGDGTILCRTLGKYKQYISDSDVGLSPYLIMDGFIEYSITEFVARNVSPGATVLDVGANYGYYAILMADLVGNNGKVYAIEPNPAAVKALKMSLRVNGYWDRVCIDERAIWNCSNEQVTFHVPKVVATNARVVWPLDGRMPPDDKGTSDVENITVDTISLDDLPLTGVSFMKADVEGAEERLWQGSKEFFERNPDIISIIEFNCLRCQDPSGTLNEINKTFPLRYLDHQSQLRNSTTDELLKSKGDWILVLTRRPQIN